MAFQRLRRALLLAACASSALLAACGGGSVESQFTPKRVVAFGDGFADLGQGGTRYTINDGSLNIWSQQLASRYGLSLTTAAAGGTSYATGNARVAATPDAAGNAATPTLRQQIDTFAASFNDADLVLLSAGTADVVAEASRAFAGTQSVDAARANIAAAGVALGDQVRRVVDAGGKHVMVVGPYNLERSPWARTIGRTGELKEFSRAFNEALLTRIVDLGANVLYVDAAGYFNLVTGSPAAYNMENATTAACTSVDAGAGIGIGSGQVNSALCTTGTLLGGIDYNRYVFADAVYPTPQAHRLFGNFAFDRIRQRW